MVTALRRAALGATVVVLAATALSACTRVGAHGRIAVVYLNAEGYYAGVQKGVDTGFENQRPAPSLVQTNVQSDPSKESTFVDQVVSAKVDALILSPTSAEASIPAVRLAHNAGVPVICYNTCLTDAATKDYVDAWILGSPAKFGQLAGEQMGRYFRAKHLDHPQVGIVNCEQFEVCTQRRVGFQKALTKLVPGARIVSNQQGLAVDDAVEKATQMLTAHPQINAFYGEAGSMTVGAVDAVQATHRAGKVAVFGGDMSTQVAQMLKSNTILKAVADISGIKVGQTTARVTREILAGHRPAQRIVPAPVDVYVTAKDAQRWLETHANGIP